MPNKVLTINLLRNLESLWLSGGGGQGVGYGLGCGCLFPLSLLSGGGGSGVGVGIGLLLVELSSILFPVNLNDKSLFSRKLIDKSLYPFEKQKRCLYHKILLVYSNLFILTTKFYWFIQLLLSTWWQSAFLRKLTPTFSSASGGDKNSISAIVSLTSVVEFATWCMIYVE